LTSIVVDAKNKTYSSQDGVLYNKAKTVLIQYPHAKSGGFTIPDSVTSIDGGVFRDCTSLTSVTIPSSVKSIGMEAFDSCTSLTRAYFLGNAPSMLMGYEVCSRWGCTFIWEGVFDGCASNFTICYTGGSTGFTTPKWYGYPAAICEKPETTTTTTISSWSCAVDFIYGENSEQTELLREYRDKVLSKTPEGQELIKTYYKLSPTVTKLLEQRPLLKNRAKAFIDSMLPGIREKVQESSKQKWTTNGE